MWYESKNIAEIVEDLTAFCPTRFNGCAAQGSILPIDYGLL